MTRTIAKNLMTPAQACVSPDATIIQAANIMQKNKWGILAVGEGDQLQGVVTDRDLVARAIAQGKDPLYEKISTSMSKEVFDCGVNDTLWDMVKKMHRHNITRLIVRDNTGKMVGVVSWREILSKFSNADELLQALTESRKS